MGTGLQTLNTNTSIVQWTERISACRSSGMKVKDWCRENGVSLGSYYRWQRRLYEMAVQNQHFVEIPVQHRASPAIVLHLPCGDVDVLPGADEETLRTVCRVLRHAE